MERPLAEKQSVQCPRIVLCGLRGGSGKTIVTLGLIGAFRKRGLNVSPFKKGPDYIDPQWIALSAGRPCRNLDSFLMSRERIQETFACYGKDGDLAVIEGNRGLYDGMDEDGTYSTAELAVQLGAPVILVVDCTKTTRTVAAMVLGCKVLNPDVPIRGVILNRIAGERQESVIRSAVERETQLPVLGAVHRLKSFSFPERHLGLYPPTERQSPEELVDFLTERIEASLDLDTIFEIAASAPSLTVPPEREETGSRDDRKEIRIGVIRDNAFHFYYPENLEALEAKGARLVTIDSMQDNELPAVDALYIGGGFPESHAERLSDNHSFRESLKREIERGLPVLAECGGLVYLGESVVLKERTYPMTGIFPVTYTVSKRPQGHGYTVLKVDRENPFFPMGLEMRGHEFRYSTVQRCEHDMACSAFRMYRGYGFDGQRDGLVYKNCLASFCHHHASGIPEWADGLIRLASKYSNRSVLA